MPLTWALHKYVRCRQSAVRVHVQHCSAPPDKAMQQLAIYAQNTTLNYTCVICCAAHCSANTTALGAQAANVSTTLSTHAMSTGLRHHGASASMPMTWCCPPAQGIPLHGPVASECVSCGGCTPALHRLANMRVNFMPYWSN